MNLNVKFILSLTIMTFYYVITEACQCSYVHPQDRFCMSDFCVHVQVENSAKVNFVNRKKTIAPVSFSGKRIESYEYPHEIEYTVEILEIFKQKGVSIQLGMGYIYTPKSVGCGLYLKIGKKYIVCGKVDRGRLYTPVCTEVLKMPQEIQFEQEKQQINNYRHRFARACGKCSFCSKYECYQTPKRRRSKHQCRIPRKWDKWSRKALDSVCLPKPNGHCSRREVLKTQPQP